MVALCRIGFGPGVGVASGGPQSEYRSDECGVQPVCWQQRPVRVGASFMDLYTLWSVGDTQKQACGVIEWSFPLAGGCLPALLDRFLDFWPALLLRGLYSLTLLSAAGITYLAGLPVFGPAVGSRKKWLVLPAWQKVRRVVILTLTALLISMNLIFYTPLRLASLQGYNNISSAYLHPFLTAPKTPTLVIVHVHNSWIDCGRFLELENPYLNTPYIFICDQGMQKNQIAIQAFPQPQGDRFLSVDMSRTPRPLGGSGVIGSLIGTSLHTSRQDVPPGRLYGFGVGVCVGGCGRGVFVGPAPHLSVT